MNGNSTLRKLLLDEKMGKVLELYEKCEINSFLEIEKYYSGGCMELNENNVCDILRFSIYYNDNRIMLICKRYLKNHLTDSIMIEIFSMLSEININQLAYLLEMSEKYIKMKGYKYLNDDKLLLKMNMKCLKFILSNRKLIIEDENWLLNRLMKWYVKVLKSENGNENMEEEMKEFRSIIESKIHLNEIRIEEISEEYMKELRELQIEINKCDIDYVCIKINEVNNIDLIEIIQKLYLKEEEECDNKMILSENEMRILRSEEVKKDLIKLLSNEDIKVIEIVLNIIMEMKISEIIPKEIKNKILSKLLSEYNESQKKLTLKCLCLFADNRKSIATMEYLCGKEILYQILNNEYYLNSKSKELLIEYIHEMKLNEEEEEEMSRIIKNEEIFEELLIKEISSFSYPQSEYLFEINEKISIIPSFDGERCEFSISPPLPLGLTIDKENGIIHGKVENEIEKKEYEVICKNVKNEKKFKISLEFVDIKFTELNKNQHISISNDGKVMTSTNCDRYNHCYLNLKMENGIYHIKYKFHKGSYDNMFLGLSTDNTYSGIDIYNQSTTCNYWACGGKSKDISSWCRIGTIVNKNPNFNNHGDGSIYEVIVDMNKREFWISHNNSSPILLVKDLPSPLYPYAAVYGNNSSVELLSVSHQD